MKKYILLILFPLFANGMPVFTGTTPTEFKAWFADVAQMENTTGDEFKRLYTAMYSLASYGSDFLDQPSSSPDDQPFTISIIRGRDLRSIELIASLLEVSRRKLQMEEMTMITISNERLAREAVDPKKRQHFTDLANEGTKGIKAELETLNTARAKLLELLKIAPTKQNGG